MRPINAATPEQIAAFRAGQRGRRWSPDTVSPGVTPMVRAKKGAPRGPRTAFVKSVCITREDGWELQLPIKTVASNANGNRYASSKIKDRQLDIVLAACQSQLRRMDRARVCGLDFIRIGPRPLDAHDNLPQSFKHVVDAVCGFLVRGDDFDTADRRRIGTFDDQLIGTGKVTCRYAQMQHELDKRLYGIRIRFRLRPS